ncbi:MAG: hypothetical protein AAF670_09305 [Planctomycetota bacterium]
MQVSAVSLAWPRMEWPFVSQWCRHLANHGVERVILGQHDRPAQVWDKRPNPAYYHPLLRDHEIKERWRDAIDKCRLHLKVDIHRIPSHWTQMGPMQSRLFRYARRRAIDADVDWVLSCDMDEFPIPAQGETLVEFVTDLGKRRPNVAAAHFRQLVFESRWDIWNEFAPRDLSSPCAYHPRVIRLHKYLYRPGLARPLNAHRAAPIESGANIINMPATRILLHHFRGIESANHRQLGSIQTLPNRTADPLAPVPFVRSPAT